MDEEKLKEAFLRIKEDIFKLGNEISLIRSNLIESNQLMKQLNDEIINLKLKKFSEKPSNSSEIPSFSPSTHNSTHNEKTSTHPTNSTHNSTHPQEIGGLKRPNFDISIGNEGASTDRQTDNSTDNSTDILPNIWDLSTTNKKKLSQPVNPVVPNVFSPFQIPSQKFSPLQKDSIPPPSKTTKPITQQISEASDILDSLDSIKKEIRRKFKSITKQEMLVFSTIYSLDEQEPEVDYKKIALKLNLSQSSIRDYIQRLIDKGIPITKEKLNNKKILLHISPQLKKIATLDTIIKLKEI